MNREPRRNEVGFTMIEMVMATVMLLSLAFLVTSMIISGTDAQRFSDRLGRVTEISQDILADMQRDLQAAVRVFDADTLGMSYRGRVAPWPQAVALASSKPSSIQVSSTFKKDVSGTEKTGNELLFARQAWSDSFTCTSGNAYRVDTYRVVYYYLRKEGVGPGKGSPHGLNLCKWVSEPLVNGAQVDAIADATDRTEVLKHLRDATPDDSGAKHSPLHVVWMVGEDPATSGTFRQILADGSMTTTPVLPRANPWEIEREVKLSSSGMLHAAHYSVASNWSQGNQGTGRFAIANNTTASVGFPHGFEVQVVGPASARKVLVHLTLVSTNAKGLKAYYDAQVVTVVREG